MPGVLSGSAPMRKIPLTPAPEPESLPPASTVVPEALDILLLGGIWWFVLILMPLLQQESLAFSATAAALLIKIHGLAVAAIATVVLILRVVTTGWQGWQAILLLAALAVLGGILVWQSLHLEAAAAPYQYTAALQGILALGYFVLQRRPPHEN